MMRDVVIDIIFAAAQKNSDIMFLSADLGAPALDMFRLDLPGQFLFMGISEQNMIDVAAGLALSGKTVFCYAMAPFITARCYEQIKCSLSAMSLPVTLIGVGVGLGYDDASITHYTIEDIACMRALNGIEIITPCDDKSAAFAAREAVARPRFLYLRLDRYPQPLLYQGELNLACGIGHLAYGKDVALVACGNMLHKAMQARGILAEQGIKVGVIDIFRIKPIGALAEILRRYDAVVTVEEHILEGGLGGAVAEVMADVGLMIPLKRLGLVDGFKIVNGTRDELHVYYGIDTSNIVEACRGFR